MKSLNDARVHLANAAFAQVECGADFFHRHLFVVVEDDDQTFVAVETFGDQTHQIAFTDTACWIFASFIFKYVDFAYIFVAIGFVPFLVQRYQADGGRIGLHLL